MGSQLELDDLFQETQGGFVMEAVKRAQAESALRQSWEIRQV
jgi:hypothetical protein